MVKNKKNSFKTIQRPSKLNELVEAQLHEAIYKNVFTQGEYLPSENDLCKIFKVSRNVVREALLVLSTNGLIEIERGKGALVVEPNINNVLDPFSRLVNYKCGNMEHKHILKVRQMIEPSIAFSSAQHRTQADIEKLDESLRMLEESKTDRYKISHIDINFHIIIANSCNNPLVPIVLEPIFHVLAKYHPAIFYNPDIIDITLKYHRKIFSAIVNKNSDDAFNAMQEHLKITEKHNLHLHRKYE